MVSARREGLLLLAQLSKHGGRLLEVALEALREVGHGGAVQHAMVAAVADVHQCGRHHAPLRIEPRQRLEAAQRG